MNFKLLWITPGFPSRDDESNCLPVLQQLALALQARGAELRVIALGYPHHTRPYTWHGIPVRSCDSRYGHPLRFWNRRRATAYAEAWFREQPFDAVHSFWLGPAWVRGKKLAQKWGVPHVCTLMGQDVLPQNRFLKHLRQGDENQLVAVSAFQNDVFLKHTGMRAAHTVPWGVNASKDQADGARDIDILGAGSLIRLKNWDLWLEAAALAAQKQPGLRAVLCGDGPERGRLEQYAAALGAPVTFAGEVTHPELLKTMRRSRVFLHTSTYESFGMVLAEAASNGCRVVSTPVGIAPELAQCGQTAEELAALVTTLVIPQGTPQRTPLVIPKGTMDDAAETYLRLYREL